MQQSHSNDAVAGLKWYCPYLSSFLRTAITGSHVYGPPYELSELSGGGGGASCRWLISTQMRQFVVRTIIVDGWRKSARDDILSPAHRSFARATHRFLGIS